MSRDATGRAAPARRDYVKYGGSVVGGGLFAGCTGDGGPEADPTATENTDTDESAGPTGPTGEDTPYEVCMEPVGCVEFERVPERWAAYDIPELPEWTVFRTDDGAITFADPETEAGDAFISADRPLRVRR